MIPSIHETGHMFRQLLFMVERHDIVLICIIRPIRFQSVASLGRRRKIGYRLKIKANPIRTTIMFGMIISKEEICL